MRYNAQFFYKNRRVRSCLILLFYVLYGATWFYVIPAHGECRRVVERVDGGVSIIIPARSAQQPSESETDWCARVFQETIVRDSTLQGLPFHDVDNSALPLDRSQRHKWRYKSTTGKVEVDPTVPDPPKSKEQQRKDTCAKVKNSATADSLLKELCATF